MFNSWFNQRALDEEQFNTARRKLVENAPIPILWLFGKTGSGKSSIVRCLTGLETVDIGTGFKPQTRRSSLYEFPDASAPILKFLDTRGLGETGYDPAEDIDTFADAAHLMIVTVRVMDHALEELVAALRKIRHAAPSRPVILALTALHDSYPGQQHPDPDPFDVSPTPLPDGIAPGLRRSLESQYQRFDGLFDFAVPIDLTPEYEGFDEPNFGGQRFKQTIIQSLPAAYRHNLLQMDELLEPLGDLQRRRTLPTILGTSSLAATAAAVPFPWIDIPVVMGLQTHLIYKLARIHEQPIDANTIAKLSGVLGSRIAVRMALRATLKFIPWVGMAANAAAAFAMTFATGMVWNWYFLEVKRGHVPTESELRDEFQNQLQRAAEVWQAASEQPFDS